VTRRDRPPDGSLDPAAGPQALHWFWGLIALGLILPEIADLATQGLRALGAAVHTSRSHLVQAYDVWIGYLFTLCNVVPFVIYTFVAWGGLETGRLRRATATGGAAGLSVTLIVWNLVVWHLVPEPRAAVVLLLYVAVLPLLVAGAVGTAIGMVVGCALTRLLKRPRAPHGP
jgi:hypothetical protein